MADNLGDTSNVANFALRLGFLCASLEDPKIIAYLKSRGIRQSVIQEAHDALFDLAGDFMRAG